MEAGTGTNDPVQTMLSVKEEMMAVRNSILACFEEGKAPALSCCSAVLATSIQKLDFLIDLWNEGSCAWCKARGISCSDLQQVNPTALAAVSSPGAKMPPISAQLDALLDRLNRTVPAAFGNLMPSSAPPEDRSHMNKTARDKAWNAYIRELESEVQAKLDLISTGKTGSEVGSNRIEQLELEMKVLSQQLQLAKQYSKETSVPEAADEVNPSVVSMVEDVRTKTEWLELMQSGNWFWRVGRRYGPLGKALKSTYRKRVFVWLSTDYKFIYISSHEVQKQSYSGTMDSDDEDVDNPAESAVGDTSSRRRNFTAIPLEQVTMFDFGRDSRAYRLIQEARTDFDPPYLCFSIATKRISAAFVGMNERDVERWVLGLSSLIPFIPGRTFLTLKDFTERKAQLRKQFYRNESLETKSSSLSGCEASSTQSCLRETVDAAQMAPLTSD